MYFRVLWKFLASFRKREWSVADYPVYFEEQVSDPRFSRFTANLWGWPVQFGYGIGSGNSRELALKDLDYFLDDYRAIKGALPRPGTRVSWDGTNDYGLRKLDKTADEFVMRLLANSSKPVFLSDTTRIEDLEETHGVTNLRGQIEREYGVDTGNIVSGNVVRILGRIADLQK